MPTCSLLLNYCNTVYVRNFEGEKFCDYIVRKMCENCVCNAMFHTKNFLLFHINTVNMEIFNGLNIRGFSPINFFTEIRLLGLGQ